MKTLLTVWSLPTLVLFASGFALANTTWDPAERTKDGNFQVSGNWSELKKGDNTLNLKVIDPSGNPVLGAEVVVDYDAVAMPMNPPNKPVTEPGEGVYQKAIKLGMKGVWRFKIAIKKDATQDKLTRDQDIKN